MGTDSAGGSAADPTEFRLAPCTEFRLAPCTELRLAPRADIQHLAEFRADCLGVVRSGGDVVLEASAVERVDAATLQVVAALRNDLHRRGSSLRIAEPSDRFDRVVAALGLTELVP